MKTKNVPAIIMLVAGLINCIISIYNKLDMFTFTKRLLFVLVIFYILGIGVKIVIDKTFPVMSDEIPEGEEEVSEEEVSVDENLENIQTEQEENEENEEE